MAENTLLYRCSASSTSMNLPFGFFGRASVRKWQPVRLVTQFTRTVPGPQGRLAICCEVYLIRSGFFRPRWLELAVFVLLLVLLLAPLGVLSRVLHYFGTARVPELSRDVRYLLESSLAHEPIEPLKWGMAQNHIDS